MKKYTTKLLSLCVSLCVLSGCANSSDFVSSDSASSGTVPLSTVSSSPTDDVPLPVRPSDNMFISMYTIQNKPFIEPDGNITALAPAHPFTSLVSFDGMRYSVMDYGMDGDSIRAALYSDNDLFYVSGTSLYYCDNNDIFLVMENVYRMAGSDASGIYLILEDHNVPLVGVARGLERQASLYHYNPVTGAVKSVLANVQNAVVAGENHDVLFYITAEASDNEDGFRYVIRRRDLQTNDDVAIFTDNDYTPFETPWSAFNIFFKETGAGVFVIMQYPKPSEYPYEYAVLFGMDGTYIQDSIEADVVILNTALYEMTLHNDRYQYTTYANPTPVGNYSMRMEDYHDGNHWVTNYDVVQDELELCWYWDDGVKTIAAYDDLIYAADNSYGYYDETQHCGVYNGQFGCDIYFWEREFIGIASCGERVYFLLSEKGEAPSGSSSDESDWLAVYQATGIVDDPTSIRFLFAFERDNKDTYGWYDSIYSTMWPCYIAGDYMIFCTYDLPNYIVYNSRTGSTASAGQSVVNLWMGV